MIKSTIDNKEAKKELPFPKLMTTKNGLIVLFSDIKSGVVLRQGSLNCREVGDATSTWDMAYFTEFDGSITLSNEV